MGLSSFISLRDGMDQHGSFRELELYHLALSLTSCLAELHERGEQHGFLSPDFVAVSIDGTIKLGTAGSEDVSSTLPEYIAPEVLTGSRVSPLSDIYQLGLLLHELSVCSAPFTLDDSEISVSAIYKLKPFSKPVPVGKKFAAIIQKCYEKDSLKRFSDGNALLAALNAIALGNEIFSNYKVEDANFSDWFSRTSKTTVQSLDIVSIYKADKKKYTSSKLNIFIGIIVAAILCIAGYGISFLPSQFPAVKVIDELRIVFVSGGVTLKWRSPEGYERFDWRLYSRGNLMKSGVVEGSSFSTYSVTFPNLLLGKTYRLSLSEGDSEVGQLAFTYRGEVN